MKKTITIICLSTLFAVGLHASTTLWNLDFKDLQPGAALTEVPYADGCTGPQKVTVNDQCPLAGAKAVGTLSPALLYTKEGTAKYTPMFMLRGKPQTSGVFTVSFDITFDRITAVPDKPVEALMIFEFVNGDGGFTHGMGIMREGSENLKLFTISGDKTAKTFKLNDVVHIKAVLDTNQHTFEVFLNDQPLGNAAKDDAKFSSFWGFKVRDGTAMGGNYGTGFTAGIGNLVITQD
ncbi:MAG: hypothetical protein LBH01_11405 [Verrucomicrobiales bacterium]|jgi:hypothetical protein|nr:hypothetical protein [Verrucomicrobiales bacterium]